MYNFKDHTLNRKLTNAIPTFIVTSYRNLAVHDMYCFIGNAKDFQDADQTSNIVLRDRVKNAITPHFSSYNQRACKVTKLNNTTIASINLGNNYSFTHDTQELTKLASAIIEKLPVQEEACSLAIVLTEEFISKLPSLRTLFLALFNALKFQDLRFKAADKPLTFALNRISIGIMGLENTKIKKYAHFAEQASVYCHAITYAHLLANLPANICTPDYVAEEALSLSLEEPNLQVQVFDEENLAHENMRGYLAVAQGAKNRPKMTMISYHGADDHNANPIVLIGKGLTFDSGGISLKPGQGMDEMMFDKCGAISVLATMQAVSQLGLKVNVIGIAACAENMPDGGAYHPGDIIQMRHGTTVEVLNTDAEGRMVLADALSYATTFNPACIIDIATLTGACMVALGSHATGLFANNEDLAQHLLLAAKSANDFTWQLPLGALYEDMIKAQFADLANTGGRLAGACTAGQFLSHFVNHVAWAHLDIAGTAWISGKHKTATGRPVALLLDFLEQQQS